MDNNTVRLVGENRNFLDFYPAFEELFEIHFNHMKESEMNCPGNKDSDSCSKLPYEKFHRVLGDATSDDFNFDAICKVCWMEYFIDKYAIDVDEYAEKYDTCNCGCCNLVEDEDDD